MLGFSPKLPVTDEDRQWVDEGFRRLEKLLGRRRMFEARIILPTAEDFPDLYDKTPIAVEKLFSRVCGYMKVDRSKIDLEIFPDETEELQNMLPSWSGEYGMRPAGLYIHNEEKGGAAGAGGTKRIVAIRSTQLQDPMSLVATVAHELGHVILLGGGLMEHRTPDHEPMTDLLTVFLGLGIFAANAAGRFVQHQDDRSAGWSMQRLGYLPENVYGYALARLAWERGENKPQWAKHLSTNVKAYFRQSHAWLVKSASSGKSSVS